MTDDQLYDAAFMLGLGVCVAAGVLLGVGAVLVRMTLI